MLNGKFICTHQNDEQANYFMKLGKVYEFKNGKFMKENGDFSYGLYTTINHFNETNFDQIAPYNPLPKDLLEHLDTVIMRDNSECVVLLKGNLKQFVDINSESYMEIYSFDSELNGLYDDADSQDDVMKIYDKNMNLKWERIEKSERDIKIEYLENEIKRIEEEIRKVKESKFTLDEVNLRLKNKLNIILPVK